MKKQFYILLFLILPLVYDSYSQHVCALSPSEQNTELCLRGYSYFEDNINASVVVDDILSKIDVDNTFFITKVCNGINNALAINIQGTRYILLDINWMESLKYANSDWFHLFVISHEIGHHIFKHTDYATKSNQEGRLQELDADQFAGYILGAYGASENDINSLLVKFPDNDIPNSTHPQKNERIEAIRKGYTTSKKSLSNTFIQSITKNAELNLNNLPHLISLARDNSNKFINSGDKTYLNKSINYYKQAIRFYDNSQIKYEFASMLLANGDKKLFFETLEYVYSSSNNEEYLIELLSSSVSLNYNTTDFISKYKVKMDAVIPENISNVHTAISLSRYYNYMGKSFNAESDYIHKARLALAKAEKINFSVTQKKQTNYYSMGEINNEYGLIELRLNNYENALDFFMISKSNFEKANLYEDKSQEKISCYYSRNILTVYLNIAGTNVRIREWEKGLSFTDLYLSYFSELTNIKRSYLIETHKIDDKEIYYFRARCQHGLGQYQDALISYNLVVNNAKSSLNQGAVEFYRGLTYVALEKTHEACKDFKYACDQGIDRACVRYKTMCKN